MCGRKRKGSLHVPNTQWCFKANRTIGVFQKRVHFSHKGAEKTHNEERKFLEKR